MKNPSLCKRRELAIPLEVVTFLPTQSNIPENDNLICADESSIYTALKEHGQEITNTYLKALNASFQRVSTIKPAKKRASVTKQDSKGAVLKSIEKEIANLDRWQMGAAIESPEGPQRIRGLAGSGKTVILALKAAYLHIANQNGILLLRLILVHCMSNLRI
ncbi:hypothetical protein ABEV54_14320 [Peribacillus psychrosaccharolyticus]|uniref:hypothetical protein n=1 Tax=Peribacillus psychrosaccharolyticus TaxID=1407 RepID=UPI003D29982E